MCRWGAELEVDSACTGGSGRRATANCRRRPRTSGGARKRKRRRHRQPLRLLHASIRGPGRPRPNDRSARRHSGAPWIGLHERTTQRGGSAKAQERKKGSLLAATAALLATRGMHGDWHRPARLEGVRKGLIRHAATGVAWPVRKGKIREVLRRAASRFRVASGSRARISVLARSEV